MGKLTHAVSGSVASFRSADVVPIESLKFHFLPKQTSGTPSPENPIPIEGWTGLNWRRAGKNLLPNNIVAGTEHSQGLTFVQNSDGSIRITGKGNNTTTKLAIIKNFPNGAFPLKAGTYRPHMWSTDTTKSQIYISIMYNNGNNSMYCNANGNSYTYTLAEDVYVNQIRIGLQPSEDVEFDLTIYPSLEKNNAPTTWEPCRSELIPFTFPVVGKNKFNPNAEWTIGSPYRYVPFYYGEHDFYMSFTVKDQSINTSDLYIGFSYFEPISSAAATAGYTWCIEKGALKQNHTNRISQGVPSDHYGMIGRYLFVYPNTEDAYNRLTSKYDIQIEEGTSATAFEPYSSDNTVYGGYVDPVAGEIVAEYYLARAKKSNFGNKSTPSSTGRDYRQTQSIFPKTDSGVEWAIARQQQKFNRGIIANPWSEASYGENIGIIATQDSMNPAITYMRISEEVYQAMNDDDYAEISYKLREPIHIPIPAEDLKAFLDHNNFWSDANGDTEVEYAFADRLSQRKLIMNTPHIESASGAVASFSTDMKAPLADLKAYFTPIQEGSGDASPENERPIHGWTGANISLVDVYEFYQGGLADLTGAEVSINTRIRTDYIPYDGSQSLVLNGIFDADDRCRALYWYDSNKEFISSGGSNNGFPYNYWVGNKPNYAYFRVVVQKSDSTQTISPNGRRLVLPKETYPIEFPAMKNLLDVTQYGRYDGGKGFVASDGIISFDEVNGGNSCIVWFTQTFPAGTYTLNAKISGDGTIGFRLLCSSSSCGGTYNSYYGGYFKNSSDGKHKISFTTTEPSTIGICLISNTLHEKEPGMAYNIQLESGSTATAYEPFKTVYGGYVDLARGKLISEYVYRTFTWGDIKSSRHTASMTQGVYTFDVPVFTATGSYYIANKARCNIAKFAWEDMVNYPHFYIDLSNSSGQYNAYIILPNETSDDLHIEIVTKLVTPIEYDLIPQQIKTLKGTNNIWSDANGNIEVKYWTH